MFNSYPNIIQKWNWAAGNLKYLDSKKMGAVVKIYYFPFYIALGLQHSACFSCENISWRRWELQLQISILTFSPLSSALLDLKHQVLIVHVQSPNWIFKSVSDDIRALLSKACFWRYSFIPASCQRIVTHFANLSKSGHSRIKNIFSDGNSLESQ